VRQVEWPLNIETFALAFAHDLMFTRWAWVELTHVKAVDADVQHRGIFQKYVCSAITHMYVPIKYTNFLNIFILLLCNSCCNSSIIEEAEAAGSRPIRMVTRRAHNSER
jgi:hypothetical protein